jgi:histone-lysine N-methyltransferase SETMAR
MGCDHATMVRHLQSIVKVQKLGVWVPHILTQDKNQCVAICASLLACHRLARQQLQSFLARIVTGDEKLCLYVNFKQRKECLRQATPRARPDLLSRKTMLCIWWDMEGIIHYDLLERNLTVTAERYCQQLCRLDEAIWQKRRNRHGVILHHDNARPHTANMTKAAFQELDWEILPHPPYSPDLAPSDYHLFSSLFNNLRGVSFNNDVSSKTGSTSSRQNWRISSSMGSKTCPNIWEAVVNNGEYIID